MDPIRLQKFFSDARIMSRRSAEAEIQAGFVTVNGMTAHVGMKIDPEKDEIIYKGKKIAPIQMKTERTYILLNKPIGYVTTMKDDRGRPIAADLLHGIHQRVYPVGRLDMYSEGLLIFTDDGELANRMMHPSHDMDKEYILSLKGEFTENDVHRYTLPMELDGYRLRPVQAHLLGTHVHHDGQICTDISVTLHEGRNRQIRKMSEQLGYKVVSLKRVRVGEIQLGTLPCGRWRYLTESEIEYLKTI